MTGFGPFKSGSDSDNTGINHVKNASWEGVKVLKERWSELATDGKFECSRYRCSNRMFCLTEFCSI